MDRAMRELELLLIPGDEAMTAWRTRRWHETVLWLKVDEADTVTEIGSGPKPNAHVK